MSERFYTPDEWPHGLRCADCSREFVEGQPIAERLEAFQDDIPIVVIVCVECDLSGEARDE